MVVVVTGSTGGIGVGETLEERAGGFGRRARGTGNGPAMIRPPEKPAAWS